MKRSVFSLIFVMVIALSLVGITSAQDTVTTCETVGGTFLFNFVDPTTAVAVLTGDLSGAVRGVILESNIGDNGVMTFTLEHAITTEAGHLIRTSDEATLTPIEENVFFMRQTQTIVSGTGAFTSATGTLTEFGVVDMAIGQGVLRYSGEICSGE